MELNTETQMDGVLSPKQADAAHFNNVQATNNTPMAKRTRSALHKKSVCEFVDDATPPSVPKTPRASTSTRVLSETPRRSARKSVRPPLDYEDIIENNLMSSASKVNSSKIATDVIVIDELADQTVQKWTAAEVGRHSRKRSRSTKRKTIKKSKIQEEEIKKTGVEELVTEPSTSAEPQPNEEEELPNKKAKIHEIVTEPSAGAKPQPNEEEELPNKKAKIHEIVTEPSAGAKPQPSEEKQLNINAVKAASTESQSNEEQQLEVKAEHSVSTEPQLNKKKIKTAKSASAEAQFNEEELKIKAKNSATAELQPQSEQTEPKPKSEPAVKVVTEDTAPILAAASAISNMAARVGDEDMDELGLSPLDADVTKEDEEEMPPLMLLEDGELESTLNRTFDGEPGDSLNGTFNADEQSNVNEDLNAVDFKINKLQEADIKVLLTDADNQNITLLNLNNGATVEKPQGYRFPTPLKCTVKPIFKFTENPKVDANKLLSPTQNKPLKSACKKRRSKSTSQLNKFVSFGSQLEITAINDIDKRWEGLNTSHVTQRRRRSKSLDENKFISRIPRPKIYPIEKLNTPVKLKTRTKLPNFAAIHQKQFNKMENLLDHMERKAVRAKELTSSALKQQQAGASGQKSSTKKCVPLAAERGRPRALKKIDLPSLLLTPKTEDEIRREKLLPTPRKIIGVNQAKPKTTTRIPLISNTAKSAFSLSTLISANDRAAPVQDKLQARRQRHMEMFKGRTTKENKGEIIRGVRSNKRFELQMKHRRQIEDKKMNNF